MYGVVVVGSVLAHPLVLVIAFAVLVVFVTFFLLYTCQYLSALSRCFPELVLPCQLRQ